MRAPMRVPCTSAAGAARMQGRKAAQRRAGRCDGLRRVNRGGRAGPGRMGRHALTPDVPGQADAAAPPLAAPPHPWWLPREGVRVLWESGGRCLGRGCLVPLQVPRAPPPRATPLPLPCLACLTRPTHAPGVVRGGR
jgi:hypothetical protein